MSYRLRLSAGALAVAAIAAFSATPAAAATITATAAQDNFTLGGGNHIYPSTSRTLSSPYTGAVQVQESGAGWLTHAETDPTEGFAPSLHFYTSTTAGAGVSWQGFARSAFTDSLDFSNFTPGTSGVANFDLNVRGQLSHTGGGYYNFFLSGTGFSSLNIVSTGASSFIDVDRTVRVSLNWTAGQIIPISVSAHAYSGVFRHAGTATADFSHTIEWGGLQSVFLSNGQNITRNAVVGSGSGLDFQSPPPNGVPEPAAWALMIAGFGLAGGALRWRRVVAV